MGKNTEAVGAGVGTQCKMWHMLGQSQHGDKCTETKRGASMHLEGMEQTQTQ